MKNLFLCGILLVSFILLIFITPVYSQATEKANNFNLAFEQGEIFSVMNRSSGKGGMTCRLWLSNFGFNIRLAIDLPFAVFNKNKDRGNQSGLLYDNVSFGFHAGMYSNIGLSFEDLPEDIGLDWLNFFERQKWQYRDTLFIQPDYFSGWTGLTFHSNFFGCRAGILINYRSSIDINLSSTKITVSPYILMHGFIGDILEPIISYIGGQDSIEPATLITSLKFTPFNNLMITPFYAYISDPYKESDLSFSQYGLRLDIFFGEYEKYDWESGNFGFDGTHLGLQIENTYLMEEYGIFDSWTEPKNLVFRTYFERPRWPGLFLVSDATFEHPGLGFYFSIGGMVEFRFGINDISQFKVTNRRHDFSLHIAYSW